VQELKRIKDDDLVARIRRLLRTMVTSPDCSMGAAAERMGIPLKNSAKATKTRRTRVGLALRLTLDSTTFKAGRPRWRYASTAAPLKRSERSAVPRLREDAKDRVWAPQAFAASEIGEAGVERPCRRRQ